VTGPSTVARAVAGARPRRLSSEQASPRLLVLVAVSATGLWLAVLSGRPELVVLAAPLVVLVVAGAAVHRWPDVAVDVGGPARCVEGDEIDLTVTVVTATGIPWLHLSLELPTELEAAPGAAEALLQVGPRRRTVVTIPVRATRWGVASPGLLTIIARDRFGLFVSSQVVRPDLRIRVHPPDGSRRAVVAPAHLHRRVGTHGSRAHGDGSDFAELRPWRPGDTARAVNWRASARRGERWVTVRHPDRSGDLVLLVDSFRDLGPLGDRLVQRAVRAALALAESNLAVHDRVGVLQVGRHIRWHRPGLGRLHSSRLVDALLETQVEPGLRAPRVEQLPLHELREGILIVALTGLLDPGAALLPLELRARGHEVAVIEVAAEGHLPERPNRTQVLGRRLWRLRRAALAEQLRRGGVTVVRWEPDQAIEQVVAALARRATGGRRAGVGAAGTPR